MKPSSIAVALAASLSLASAFAQSGPSDPQIAGIVVTANQIDIDAGKLAKSRTKNKEVSQFAQQMITDHTKLSHGMAALVSKKGFTTTPTADSALVGKLQTLKGKEFDQAYVEQVGVEAHQRAVDLFTQQSQSGTDPQLKAAAAHALPTIKHHLEMAEQLAGAMKGSS